jgi:hypothetical protein
VLVLVLVLARVLLLRAVMEAFCERVSWWK